MKSNRSRMLALVALAALVAAVIFPSFSSSSGNFGPQEFVSGAITPGNTYRYRVVGFINGPTQVNIASKRYFPAGMGPAGSTGTALPTTGGATLLRVIQFTVNQLTKTVSVKL